MPDLTDNDFEGQLRAALGHATSTVTGAGVDREAIHSAVGTRRGRHRGIPLLAMGAVAAAAAMLAVLALRPDGDHGDDVRTEVRDTAPPASTTTTFDGYAWAVVLTGDGDLDARVVADMFADVLAGLGSGQAQGPRCVDMLDQGVAGEPLRPALEFETEELANQARRAIEAHGFPAKVMRAEGTCLTTNGSGG